MAIEQQSSPSKCILINPNTMGSLSLGPEQINLIILALIGFTHEVTGADAQTASDLADTLHKHVFDRPLLKEGGGGGGAFKQGNHIVPIQGRLNHDTNGIRRR